MDYATEVKPTDQIGQHIIDDAIKQEYYESKEWARQNNFVWKEKINDVFTVQLCWKTMKEIFDFGLDTSFERRRVLARNAWRNTVQVNFQV